jgi:7-carboxy-7-deazaguanine synthase
MSHARTPQVSGRTRINWGAGGEKGIMENGRLLVNEIFASILGESTYAGLPCAFVRLAGCNLRCSYCDTSYAYENGIEMSVEQAMRSVTKFNLAPVLITGGEPLLQEPVYDLMNRLLDAGHIVLVETNGSLPIDKIPGDASAIVDLKCPGSGECHRNVFRNLDFLSEPDNVKFVLRDRTDYEWAVNVIDEYRLDTFSDVLMSPVTGELDPRELSNWMLEDKIVARLSLQIHKILWGADVQGK